MSTQKRHSSGTKVAGKSIGGRFAATPRTEPSVDIDPWTGEPAVRELYVPNKGRPDNGRDLEARYGKRVRYTDEPSWGFPMNPEPVTEEESDAGAADCRVCSHVRKGFDAPGLFVDDCYMCAGTGQVTPSRMASWIRDVEWIAKQDSNEPDYEAIMENRAISRLGDQY